jgi:galactonate dehydratase
VIAEAAVEAAVSWMECPLPETPEQFADLKRLRALAHKHGMRLTGGEHEIRLAGFKPFLDAGVYDVMMPDAKYAGGLAEMLRIAEAFARAGVGFSPHNPTGPVCHAASLQVAAAVENLDSLEMQFDETEHFDGLQLPHLTSPEAGAATLPPSPGLGLALDPGRLARLRSAQWSAERP